jgi:hypothetical protein
MLFAFCDGFSNAHERKCNYIIYTLFLFLRFAVSCGKWLLSKFCRSSVSAFQVIEGSGLSVVARTRWVVVASRV